MKQNNSKSGDFNLLRKGCSLLFFLLFIVFSVNAQEEIIIEGQVTSEKNDMPLPGVNVIEEGTSNGVVTDMDGNFQIEVASDAILNLYSNHFQCLWKETRR